MTVKRCQHKVYYFVVLLEPTPQRSFGLMHSGACDGVHLRFIYSLCLIFIIVFHCVCFFYFQLLCLLCFFYCKYHPIHWLWVHCLWVGEGDGNYDFVDSAWKTLELHVAHELLSTSFLAWWPCPWCCIVVSTHVMRVGMSRDGASPGRSDRILHCHCTG